MATRFITNIDLVQNQILNGRFESLATDPSTNNFEGRMIYNSTEDTIKVYTGSAWRKMIHSVQSSGTYTDAITVTESNGTISIQLNLADTDSAGLLSADFWNLLNGATSDATVSTLVKRDANGNIKVAEPTDPAHAATKGYVDGARSGLDVKQSVKLATNAALPAYTYLNGVITASADGALLIDGANPLVGNRILVKNETSSNAPYNGIYDVTATGGPSAPFVLTRSSDADSAAEVTPGMFVFVEQGDNWSDSGWVLTTDGTITIGSTNLTFVQFSSAGQSIAGDGLVKTGNKIDVAGTADRIVANADSVDIASTYVGQTSITTLGTITTGVWDGTAVAVTAGGTGQESFTDNGIIYGNGTGALDVTAAGSQHQVLKAGSGGVPEFGAVDLGQSAAITGTLPIASGGTNATSESTARTNLAAGGVQGAGVSVPALSRKVVKTIGDGLATTFTVVHAFNTRDVMIQVYDAATYDTVIVDTIRTDADTVTVTFATAPAENTYKVIVIG